MNNPLRYTDPSGWLTEAEWDEVEKTWYDMVTNPDNFTSGIYTWGGGGGYSFSSDPVDSYNALAAYNNENDSWGNTLYPDGATVVKHSYYNGKTTYVSKTTGWTCEAHDAVWYSFEENSFTQDQNSNFLFQSEAKGFQRIWNSSFKDKMEYGAVITPYGLITFKVGPDGGNAFGGLSYKWKGNNCYVEYNGSNYLVMGAAHVHWDKELDPSPSQTTDYPTAYYTLKKQIPLFILGFDKEIYMINYTKIDYSDYINKYKVDSLLKGNLSLIQMLKVGRTLAK